MLTDSSGIVKVVLSVLFFPMYFQEAFITFEDKERDLLVGLVRLRKPSEGAHRPEIDDSTTLVRELHVCVCQPLRI